MTGPSTLGPYDRGAGAAVAEEPDAIARRLDTIDWAQAGRDLDACGCALVPAVLDPDTCATIAGSYDTIDCFAAPL